MIIKIIECREKRFELTTLVHRYIVDTRDANDTAVLLLDLMEEEFVAVRCSANGSCLYNSISLLIKGKCFKACSSCSCWRMRQTVP